LMPQLVAATHPITFMGLPCAWSVIQLCLSFESIGVTHFSWVLASTTRYVFQMAPKEDVKSNTKERRSKSGQKIEFKEINLRMDEKKEGNVGCLDFDQSIAPENMNCNIIDADKLFSYAEDGLSNASNASLSSRAVLNWLKDDSIKNAYGLGKTDGLPMPATIVRYLIQNNLPVPRYLLPPSHSRHIPPHIVAYELLRREECRHKERPYSTEAVIAEQVFQDTDNQSQHTA